MSFSISVQPTAMTSPAVTCAGAADSSDTTTVESVSGSGSKLSPHAVSRAMTAILLRSPIVDELNSLVVRDLPDSQLAELAT